MSQAIQTYSGPKKERSYIVTLNDDVAKDTHLDWLARELPGCEVTHNYRSSFLNAYAATCDEETLNALSQSPDIETISEDGIMKTKSTVKIAKQTDAPWGIARISQNSKVVAKTTTTALNFDYKYKSPGVDVYVIDTGIRIDHEDFSGRARWGKTFGKNPDVDDAGHGTHCAGTIGGCQFGVAKNANLVAVKVLDSKGSGFTSDIIEGMDWVAQEAESTGNPSIANLSFGGGPSLPLDRAVAGLTRVGVHVTVAAGNESQDAENTSPARAPQAITVGASTIDDVMASFSNFGPAVDIFAPGEEITSASNTSTTGSSVMDGTSMAAPHVAGLVAYLIYLHGNKTPDDMKKFLKSLSVKNVLKGLPRKTINELARNNV